MTATGFECACKPGYSGDTCAIDACETTPCDHGTCKRNARGRTCECQPDWQGDACDVNTNAALRDLRPSAGTLFPRFQPNVGQYTVDVGIGAPDVSLTAVAQQPDGVTIRMNGTVVSSGEPSAPFSIGLNGEAKANVEIRAKGGAVQTYEITFRRTLAQQAYLPFGVANSKYGGGCPNNRYGNSVAFDGTTLLVGSPLRGLVQIYSRNGRTLSPVSSLSTVTTLDGIQSVGASFGCSVTLDAGWVFISAPQIQSVFAYPRSTFSRPDPPAQQLRAPDAVGDFGATVAVSGDWLAVSAPGNGDDGRVHLFQLVGREWQFRQTLQDPVATSHAYFGYDVSLDGELLVVGAPEPNVDDKADGAAYIFERVGDSWRHVHTIAEADIPFVGSAVALAKGIVAVASWHWVLGPSFIGQPWLGTFERVDGKWVQTGSVALQTVPEIPGQLAPADFGATGMRFDGRTIVLGASGESVNGKGVDPHKDAELSPILRSGAVFAFVRESGRWQLGAYLKASNPDAEDEFGTAVALYGDTIVVAAPGEDSKANTVNGDQTDNSAKDSGAVYIFHTDCTKVPQGADVPGC